MKSDAKGLAAGTLVRCEGSTSGVCTAAKFTFSLKFNQKKAQIPRHQLHALRDESTAQSLGLWGIMLAWINLISLFPVSYERGVVKLYFQSRLARQCRREPWPFPV